MPSRNQARTASTHHRRSFKRRFKAALRDTWVLTREFRDGLLFFLVVQVVGALLFRLLWNHAHPDVEPMRYIESLFHILSMTFLQPAIDFPREWYLDMFFFIMPVLGLIALARGLADFGTLLFNRNSREGQWEEAVASVISNHIIVAGLGHLGIRVVRELVILDEEIVVVEAKEDSPRFAEVRNYDIPIIVGDARTPEVLLNAGLDRANALIICTNNDLINLQIAAIVRELNPEIRMVMRMFDDAFARSIADRFAIGSVMSASMMAAPAFAGAATGTAIIQTFKLADRVLVMGRIEVRNNTPLDGALVSTVEDELNISIILWQSNNHVDLHPEPDHVLRAGDQITVIAELPNLKQLASRWNRPG